MVGWGRRFILLTGFRGRRDSYQEARISRKLKIKPKALVAHAKLADVKDEESIKRKKTPPSTTCYTSGKSSANIESMTDYFLLQQWIEEMSQDP